LPFIFNQQSRHEHKYVCYSSPFLPITGLYTITFMHGATTRRRQDKTRQRRHRV